MVNLQCKPLCLVHMGVACNGKLRAFRDSKFQSNRAFLFPIVHQIKMVSGEAK